MANSNPKPNYGNRGGGRLGFTYEKEQLIRLRKIVDRGIAIVEAIQKGKATKLQIARYQATEKLVLKALDKLQANKHDMDVTSGGKPIPLLANLNVHNNNGNTENSPAE